MRNLKKCGKWKLNVFLLMAVLSIVGTIYIPSSEAFTTNIGEAKLNTDFAVTYSAGWRVRGPEAQLLANINGDDGNRNFEKWDMINNRFGLVTDIDMNYKNQGIFVRPKAFYDSVYDSRTANDSPGTWNNNPPIDNKYFDPKTQDAHRDKAEILDWFYYNQFDVADHEGTFRIGQQVVNWGEGLFIANGISSAMYPVDATAANTPGTTLKEIALPTEQIYTVFGLTDNLTLTGFYQWEWEKTRLDEQGSFFSTSDLLDDAGRRYLTSTGDVLFTRGRDNDASDTGQFGIGARYVVEELANGEFGLYYINYHDKTPQLLISGSQYYLNYVEDIKLYAASYGGTLFGNNIGVELTYRDDFPLSTAKGYQNAYVAQVQISSVYLGAESAFWDNFSMTTEIGANRVGDYDGDLAVGKDRTAYGGAVQPKFTYYQVFPQTDLGIPITYRFNPKGTSPVAGTFSEKADSLGIKFEFTYVQRFVVAAGYNNFLGDAKENNKMDRDNVALTMTYTF
jgi:hypothetical protein